MYRKLANVVPSDSEPETAMPRRQSPLEASIWSRGEVEEKACAYEYCDHFGYRLLSTLFSRTLTRAA